MLTRDDLETVREKKFSQRHARLIYRKVVDEERIDVLASLVLGFDPQPHHIQMMQWQQENVEGLLLAWRGAAKTTFCTVTRIIYELIRNPNIRILITAAAVDQSKIILRQIKNHLRYNEKFRQCFGDLTTNAKVWSETEITINRRTEYHGEPTVMAAGMGTSLPSRHFDLIISDDLVVKDNCTTEGLRKKISDYYYQTLLPTLMRPHGRIYVIGTRWHEEDFYNWLEKEDFAGSTLRIGVLDEETDQSRWESNFTTADMHRIRKANLAAFELQYMCRSGVGLGGIFSPEHFVYYDDEFPENCNKWQGVDLAIGQRENNDFFAHATILMQRGTRDPYLVSYRKTKVPFPKQIEFVNSRYREHPDTIRVVIEKNAYQDALRQAIKAKYPDIPAIGKWTFKDKVTRAQKLAYYLTEHPLRIRRSQHQLVRLLCGFPHAKGSKDVFDALDLAINQGLRGARKRRADEPGLI